MKKYALWLLFLLALLLGLDGVSWIGLSVQSRKARKHRWKGKLTPIQKRNVRLIVEGHTPYTHHHITLGWDIRPNATFGLFRSNAQGLRALRLYTPAKSPSKTRLIAFGDSFTHGDEVANKEAWTHRLEVSAPNQREVINAGVPGYGLDQAYLRYHRLRSVFQSDVVLIGFMSENIHRHVNTFRPFYYAPTHIPMAKPRFTVDKNGALAQLSNPLPTRKSYLRLLAPTSSWDVRLGRHDYFYQRFVSKHTGPYFPSSQTLALFQRLRQQLRGRRTQTIRDGQYNTKAEAFRVTTKLMQRFVQDVHKHGQHALLLIFPNRKDLVQHMKHRRVQYQPLLDWLTAKRLPFVDLRHAFALDRLKQPAALHPFFRQSNYSPRGNQLIANHLAAHPRLRAAARSQTKPSSSSSK